MSDTIYSYYKTNLSQGLSCRLGYRKNSLSKLDDYSHAIGMVCIRIDRPPIGTPGEQCYQVSYAFCSPSDNFSRKIAKRICDSRMQNGYRLEIKSQKPLKARELAEEAINLIHEPSKGIHKAKVRDVKVPNWFSLSERNDIVPHHRNKKIRRAKATA